ncbi:EthD domain-containing protein [Kocuria palustris]|uniref:EthD domain-containing protein n=1 Tax=Kocuria palustris TaxID=71999 RepID=UPI0011AAD8CE|nr:EthD domain-containing protein [Kocuria palustris]
MSLHHRIAFLIPHAENFPASKLDEFHEHWNDDHGEFIMPVEQVVGYVQDRPVDHQWHWDQFHGIAELFFESPEQEEKAWEHPAWNEKLRPDEDYMFDVDNGFSALVTGVREIRGGQVTRTRVLLLGADAAAVPESDRVGAIHEISLDSAVPVEGGGDKLLSVFTRGRDVAQEVAQAAGGRAAIVDAVQMIAPEGWPAV